MFNDPIIEELHQIREAHAAKFNYDWQAIYDDLKQFQEKCRQQGYKIVSMPFEEKENEEVTDEGKAVFK